MKLIIKIVLVLVLIVAGYAVWIRTDGNLSVDEIKKLSVGDMTDSLTTLSNKAIDQIRQINLEELKDITIENKDDILSFLEDNNVSLENVDMKKLNQMLEDNGLSLEKLGVVKDETVKEKIINIIESAKSK